ncbi:MAG TPA: RNA methyltransferase [Moheibacter sp.]|nr:RNA methyltransferase [Moheibacter sp.]
MPNILSKITWSKKILSSDFMQIESVQNPKIKNLLKLQEKSRERKKQRLFVVEGVQENQLAINAGFVPEEFFVCENIFQNAIDLSGFKSSNISASLFEKLAYRDSTGGILGVFQVKQNQLEEIKLKENALIVVLESVEKPGNLGAVLRTCDGAGVDLLLVCDPLVDFFNPNVIRSSVGTVFTNKIVSAEKEVTLNWLKKNKIRTLSTFLRKETKNLYETDFTKSTAIVLGTEAVGLTDFWAENSDELIKIPMHGKVDSLNVSNAAAICIYEAVRQRS